MPILKSKREWTLGRNSDRQKETERETDGGREGCKIRGVEGKQTADVGTSANHRKIHHTANIRQDFTYLGRFVTFLRVEFPVCD